MIGGHAAKYPYRTAEGEIRILSKPHDPHHAYCVEGPDPESRWGEP